MLDAIIKQSFHYYLSESELIYHFKYLIYISDYDKNLK